MLFVPCFCLNDMLTFLINLALKVTWHYFIEQHFASVLIAPIKHHFLFTLGVFTSCVIYILKNHVIHLSDANPID